MNEIRRAAIKDIPGILDLLVQVDMVHHNGRPDLFKGPAIKYNADQLAGIIADDETPVVVCVLHTQADTQRQCTDRYKNALHR